MDFVLPERYRTGIDELDRQHEVLLRLGERCLDRDLSAQQQLELLRFLVQYAQAHFETEEFAMDLFGFPGAEAHKRDHALLRAQLDQRGHLASTRRMSAPAEHQATALLRRWITQHVLGADAELARFLSGPRPMAA